MSFTGDPQTLLPGAAAIQVSPPGNNQQFAAVAIQNLSPYLATVTVGNNAYSLPAYTSDLYTLAAINTPVQITATNPDDASGVPGYIVPVWYAPDEISASAAYPSVLSPPPIAIALAVAELEDSELLIWITGTTAPATAGGTVTVDVATVTDPMWLIYQAVIFTSDASGNPQFVLCDNSVTPANVRAINALGNSNSALWSKPLQFLEGHDIVAAWENCPAGMTGTVNLAYRSSVPT